MKSVYQLFPKEFLAGLLFGLFVLVLIADVSEAQFFHSKHAESTPRTRMGCYPFSALGTDFLDVEDLGRHTYKFGFSEKNGILYTCRGGHIDTAHLRKAADWTAYVSARTFENLRKGKTRFSFRLMEPSVYHVEIQYPENWKDLPKQQRENIVFDTSIRLGEYFVYTATTWHEILTWFGYKCTGFLYSEFASSFTWEDTFSNLLGTHVAGEALRDLEHEYDEAMTLALEREIRKLGVQSSQTAKRASKKVKGEWFSSGLGVFVSMKRRHFDIGLEDGFVTPVIVPSVAGCEGAEPLPYRVPSLDFLGKYGLSVKLEIEPREMEADEILDVVYSGNAEENERLEPGVHFAAIMNQIKEDAIRKYGRNVDLCEESSRRLVKSTLPKESVKPAAYFSVIKSNNKEDVAKKYEHNVVQREGPVRQPIKTAQAKGPTEPAVHITSITDNRKVDTIMKYDHNIVRHEEPVRQPAKAAQAKEQAEPAVSLPAVKDNSKKNAAMKYDHNADLYEEPSRQMAKAVSSPMKTYDFGFKVSKSYFGNTTNETVAVVDVGNGSEFDIEQLVTLASRWLEAVNE